jgi:single-strand DNA-binding protein
MRTLNKVFLVGNLTRDPEITTLDGGLTLAKFTVATDRFKGKGEEKEKKTDYHSIVAWRGLADLCEKFLAKGSKVFVEGKIHHEDYKNKNGKTVRTTEINAEEIQFLSKPQRDEEIELVEVAVS